MILIRRTSPALLVRARAIRFNIVFCFAVIFSVCSFGPPISLLYARFRLVGQLQEAVLEISLVPVTVPFERHKPST